MTTTDVYTCIFCGQPIEDKDHVSWTNPGTTAVKHAHRTCLDEDMKALEEQVERVRREWHTREKDQGQQP